MLFVIDATTTALFGLEMVMTILVKGLVGHPGAYLRNPWDVLDGIIVIISLLNLTALNIQVLRGNAKTRGPTEN